jgi:hypothetical protein
MMNKRTLFFVLALALVSVAVLYGVSVWLPAHGWTRLGPLLGVHPLASPIAGRILGSPLDRSSFPFLGVRPFGLHREGAPGILWQLGSFVSLLLVAAITLFVAPQRVTVLARVVSNGWGQRLLAFVIGLLGYLGMALLAFLIFINLVGWPLEILLALFIYFATVLGLVAVALALGSALVRACRLGERGPLFRLGVGIVVLFVASIIPYVGWLVAGVSAVLGFGAVLWTRGGSTSGWSLDEIGG